MSHDLQSIVQKHYYASCGNRHCNRCVHRANAIWLEKQVDQMLPVPMFMVTITLPSHLRDLFSYNPKLCYDTFLKVSAEVLDHGIHVTQRWGTHIKTSFAAFLHTWSQNMTHHPHIQVLVQAGGFDEGDGAWVESNPNFLAAFKAISPRLRDQLCKRLHHLWKLGQLKLPTQRVFESSSAVLNWMRGRPDVDWRIKVNQPHGGSCSALDYMARYVNRTAIANSRIANVSDASIDIVVKDNDTQRTTQHIESMTPLEFLKRFLKHILPKGFTRIRWYGFLSCAKRAKALREIREDLKDASPPVSLKRAEALIQAMMERLQQSCCPKCSNGRMQWLGIRHFVGLRLKKQLLAPVIAAAPSMDSGG